MIREGQYTTPCLRRPCRGCVPARARCTEARVLYLLSDSFVRRVAGRLPSDRGKAEADAVATAHHQRRLTAPFRSFRSVAENRTVALPLARRSRAKEKHVCKEEKERRPDALSAARETAHVSFCRTRHHRYRATVINSTRRECRDHRKRSSSNFARVPFHGVWK